MVAWVTSLGLTPASACECSEGRTWAAVASRSLHSRRSPSLTVFPVSPSVSSATDLLIHSLVTYLNPRGTEAAQLNYLKLIGRTFLLWPPCRSPISQWVGCSWVRCSSPVQSMPVPCSSTAESYFPPLWPWVGQFPLRGPLDVASPSLQPCPAPS